MKYKFSVLVLLAFGFVLMVFCHLHRKSDRLELLNGIRDTADIEGYGILEYELYDVPGNESSDFQTFILSYTQMLGEYIFDKSSKYWIENNTALSRNVKTLMYNNKRNLSTTRLLNPDGSTRFVFNFFTYGRYEFYSIDAYEKNISGSIKIIKKIIDRSHAKPRERAIKDTLNKVAKKFEADEDVNGDGETNCVDASIWFYSMYPYRGEVKITVNYELRHAFNTVKISNTWRCIEPQAFVHSENGSYFMEDLWDSQYDPMHNKDGSFLFIEYLRYKNINLKGRKCSSN